MLGDCCICCREDRSWTINDKKNKNQNTIEEIPHVSKEQKVFEEIAKILKRKDSVRRNAQNIKEKNAFVKVTRIAKGKVFDHIVIGDEDGFISRSQNVSWVIVGLQNES